MPKDSPTGSFKLTVTSKSTQDVSEKNQNYYPTRKYFRVEEYKRPTFRVGFDKLDGAYKTGDSVHVAAFAKAYIGQPLTNAKVKYTITRSMRNGYWGREGDFFSEEKIIASQQTNTDANGKIQIDFKALPDQQLINMDYNPVYNYGIRLEVTDINGETQGRNKTVQIAYEPFEILMDFPYPLDINKNKIQISPRSFSGNPVNAHVIMEIYSTSDPEIKAIPTTLISQEFLLKLNGEVSLTTKLKEKKKTLVYLDTLYIDNKKKVDLPITLNWKNGFYLIKLRAAEEIENLSDPQITHEEEIPIWVNKELPIQQSILGHQETVKGDEVTVDLFTSLDSVRVDVLAYDRDGIVKQEIVNIKKGKTTLTYKLDEFEGDDVNFQIVA